MAKERYDLSPVAADYDVAGYEKLTSREMPYDLPLVSMKGLYEVDDPRNEAATEAYWRPILERLHIRILGVRDLPTRPVLARVDDMDWW